MPKSEKVEALDRIKEAKELLDIEAITEDEFNKVKDKYLKILHEPTNIPEIPHDIEINDNIPEINKFNDILQYQNIDDIDLSEKINYIITHNQQKSCNSEKKFIVCPNCGSITSTKQNRCSHCNIMFNKFVLKNAKSIGEYKPSKIDNENFINCPNCGKHIPKNAIRCKYCKVMLNDRDLFKSKEILYNQIESIPMSHLRTIFERKKYSFSSKSLFLSTVKSHWNEQEIIKFLDEYQTLLNQKIILSEKEEVNDDTKNIQGIFTLPNYIHKLDEINSNFNILNTNSKYSNIEIIKKYERTNDTQNDKLTSKHKEKRIDLKICHNCGKNIPKNAIRCKYCKVMLKESENNIYNDNELSSYEKIQQIPIQHLLIIFEDKHMSFNSKQEFIQHINLHWNDKDVSNFLDYYENFKYKLPEFRLHYLCEHNKEELCRVFSIPNLGKDFIINKILNDYTEKEIYEKLELYFDSSHK